MNPQFKRSLRELRVRIELMAITICWCTGVNAWYSCRRDAEEDGVAGRYLRLHETATSHSGGVGQVHTELL